MQHITTTTLSLCDIGNTSYHFLINNHESKEDVEQFDPTTINYIVYYISVNSQVSQVLKKLDNWIDLSPYIEIDKYYPTMGIDRIIACESIENGCIIDAGSAITVDIVKNSSFKGGFIYPGIKAMQQTYKNISPALNYSFNFDFDLNVLAKNSQDAISYGYLKGLYNEIISYNLPIILTGGDAQKFVTVFKDAKLDEGLIFKGMQKIFQLR